MPFEEKVRNGVGRHVLKRVMSDVLPRPAVAAEAGVPDAAAALASSDLAAPVERRLRTSAIHELGYLDGEAVQRLLQLHLSAKENARTSSGFAESLHVVRLLDRRPRADTGLSRMTGATRRVHQTLEQLRWSGT